MATVLPELLVPDERVLLAKGGDGGFGNLHFKSSTNRAAPKAAGPSATWRWWPSSRSRAG